MDKFDRSIRKARETYEPRGHFVDLTIAIIRSQQTASKNSWRGLWLWISLITGAVVVIVLVFALLPAG